jgi:hypothetical protein
MQAPNAPVLGVRTTLHHPAPLQPVDQAGDRDRLYFQDFRELLLRQARLALQPDQDAPLGAGHAMRTGPLVGIHAQQPGYVVKQEQQVALKTMHRLDDPFPRWK